nr:immunoglobulin heavy chain junction region [Mus musculus]MBK4198349.1 immunoglobulin heavy chain junction region [Mus musculus]MBK4198350.1 immunoglobulin heavy chain junction region [Mus musculus]
CARSRGITTVEDWYFDVW